MVWETEDLEERIPFDKDKIIEEIQKYLPEHWSWYTMKERSDYFYEILPGSPKGIGEPQYDIVVSRIKKVSEIIIHDRPFLGPRTQEINSVYSVNLGVFIRECTKDLGYCSLDSPNFKGETAVTDIVIINSAKMLFRILDEIDKRGGGVLK